MMYEYPVELIADEAGGFTVTFPDLPYGVAEGDDEEEAVANAVAALETVMISLMADKQDIPAPSRALNGQRRIALPGLSALKVALYQAMRARNVRKAELGRRLGLHMPQVDRLLDLRHASRLDQIEAALHALGKTLTIDVKDAA